MPLVVLLPPWRRKVGMGGQPTRAVIDTPASPVKGEGIKMEEYFTDIAFVPRTCPVRQERDAWGGHQSVLPLCAEQPGRTQDAAPRRWHGQSVIRQMGVE